MATLLKYTDILKQIKDKAFSPVYFLWGEEEYYIDLLSEAFENVLDESQKDFDFSMIYGLDLKKKDLDFGSVIANCKRYPMTSPYQVVIVKEAQNIDRWEVLEEYLKHPVPTTILVFCYKYKKIDKRKSVFKQLEKSFVLFESTKLKDAQFATWISAYLKDKGLVIGNKALGLISESLENNLKLTANELDKLAINLPPQTEVTEDHIELYIGINKEYNVFVLTRALSDGDLVLTRKIVNYMKCHLKEQPLMMILPQLYKYFCKVLCIHSLGGRASSSDMASTLGIPPFFLREYLSCAQRYNYSKTAQIISILKKYDLKSKGVDGSADDGEGILEEVIYHITH